MTVAPCLGAPKLSFSHPYTEDHPHTEDFCCQLFYVATLDQRLAIFLRKMKGQRSYAVFARELGIAESSLYRLTNEQQSATLRVLETIMQRLQLSPKDIFGEEVQRDRTRRG